VQSQLQQLSVGQKKKQASSPDAKRRGRRMIAKTKSVVMSSDSNNMHLGQMGVAMLTTGMQEQRNIKCYFDVCTTLESRHAGRILNFRAESIEECQSWVHDIKQAIKGFE
jgi:hypothetical protein